MSRHRDEKSLVDKLRERPLDGMLRKLELLAEPPPVRQDGAGPEHPSPDAATHPVLKFSALFRQRPVATDV